MRKKHTQTDVGSADLPQEIQDRTGVIAIPPQMGGIDNGLIKAPMTIS
jgi:hypothetical protein